MIDTVALDTAPIVAPAGADNSTLKARPAVAPLSRGIEKLLSVVSPVAQASVPEVAV